MSEALTLFCRRMPEDIASFQQRLQILKPTTVEQDGWKSIRCHTENGSVQISRKVYEQNGDPFSSVVYGAIVYFKRRKDGNPEGVKAVLAHLEAMEAAIGMVADPSFERIEKLEALVMFLAVEFDGMIFNGESMLDATGEPVA